MDKERKKAIYMNARAAIGCSQNDWARLFTLTPLGGKKHRQRGQSNVGLKETGKKGVTMSECLASELLRFLDSEGYDISALDFDEDHNIIYAENSDK